MIMNHDTLSSLDDHDCLASEVKNALSGEYVIESLRIEEKWVQFSNCTECHASSLINNSRDPIVVISG